MRHLIKNCIFLILLYILYFSTYSQAQTTLLFENPTYNIGNVIKSDKAITHSFTFKNVGAKPINILNVVPDCSCLTISYPQTAIQPNETGVITVSYLPYRAGAFEKGFVVNSDGNPRTQTLTLKGFITPNTNPANIFTHKNGRLYFRYKNLNFGSITNQSTVARKFEMYNPSEEDIYFTDRVIKPSHINVYFDSSHIIPAGKVGAIVLTYNPVVKNEVGFFQEEIIMFTADKDSVRMTIAIEIQGEQYTSTPAPIYISPTTSVRKPTLKVSEMRQNLGNIYPDMIVITEFVIYNEGSLDLKIEKLETDEFCEVQDINNWQNMIIPPHQFRIIKVRFKQGKEAGKQQGKVTIYSNDIATPSQNIEFQANVMEY